MLLFFLFCVFGKICGDKIIHLGILGPWNKSIAIGSHCAGAILIAIDEIESDTNTFREIHRAGHNFTFTWVDTQCHPSFGISLITQFFCKNNKVDAFIGPVCSVVCEPAGYLANYWRKPMISFGCQSDKLSDKSVYPTFARTFGRTLNGPVYLRFLQTMNYKQVAIFSAHESVWISLAASIRKLLIKAEISVTDYLTFGEPGRRGKDDLSRDLESIRQRCKGKVKMLLLFSQVLFPKVFRPLALSFFYG